MHQDLLRAAARNLGTHSTWVQQRAGGMRARVTPQLSLGDSGLPTDTFSIVSGARFGSAAASDEARRAIAWYENHPFSWWLSPGDTPADLATVLGDAGLIRVEEEAAMHCDLRGLIEHGEWPKDLTVSRVATASELAVFARLLAGLADPPDPLVLRFFSIAQPCLLAADCPIRCYLGWRDGAPVATAEVTVAHGVAGLYNVSTVAAERGQGIGTAITVLALAEARRDGAEFAVLQAAEGAQGVYARVGFTRVGVVAEYKPAIHAHGRL